MIQTEAAKKWDTNWIYLFIHMKVVWVGLENIRLVLFKVC